MTLHRRLRNLDCQRTSSCLSGCWLLFLVHVSPLCLSNLNVHPSVHLPGPSLLGNQASCETPCSGTGPPLREWSSVMRVGKNYTDSNRNCNRKNSFPNSNGEIFLLLTSKSHWERGFLAIGGHKKARSGRARVVGWIVNKCQKQLNCMKHPLEQSMASACLWA